MFASTYPVWRIVVDLRLRQHTGRPLADAPVTDGELLHWWGLGVPAEIVGNGLSTKVRKVARVTFTRFYTDDAQGRMLAQLSGG